MQSRTYCLTWLGCVPVSYSFTGTLQITSTPPHISQTFDNIYHLNAVKFIAATGNGSSLTIGNLTKESEGFYPAAMHDLFALVHQITNLDIPTTMNICALVFAGVVWPAGAIFLTTLATGRHPVPIIIAGVLSAGFGGFPYINLAHGVLYPFFTAVAILPSVLGLCVMFFRRAKHSDDQKSSSTLIWIAATAPGLALCHPSVVIALLLLCLPLALERALSEAVKWYRQFRANSLHPYPAKDLTFWFIFALLYGSAFTIIWVKVRPDTATARWENYESTGQAIGEVLTAAPYGAVAAWVILFLTLAGIHHIVKHKHHLWYVLAFYTLFGILHVFAAGWGVGTLRSFMVGTWYADPYRPAGMLPVVTLPLASLGGYALYQWLFKNLEKILTRSRIGQAGYSARAISAILIGFALLCSQSGTLDYSLNYIRSQYAFDKNSKLLTPSELKLLKKVKKIVPKNDVIVGNPFTGTALAYALADRNVLTPHAFGDRTSDEKYLLQHWKEGAYNKRVCSLVKKYRAYWALDFGTDTVIGTGEEYLGVRDLEREAGPGFKKVASTKDAYLFKLIACDSKSTKSEAGKKDD